jgi:hypothetical protein
MSALVADGSIKMIELQAVPRSLSTAMGRCLNESGTPSVFVNEPFNPRNRDIDIAADYIIRSVESALSSTGGPVVVVSKSMAVYLSAPVFRTWTEACSAVVWCVRDPRAQLASLVTRIANDRLFGVGSSRLTQSDLLPSHLVAATEVLQNSEMSQGFSRAGWREIGAHFTDFDGRCPTFVVNGSLISVAPKRFLRYLCAGLGIEFRDRMVNGWTEPLFNVGWHVANPDLDYSVNAWIKHAATSCALQAIDRLPLEVPALPAALRQYLLEVALPTYETLMSAFPSQTNLAQFVGDTQVAGVQNNHKGSDNSQG